MTLTEYERVMDTIQNLEQHDDHESRTKRPSRMWSHYCIEYQAVRLYNNKIFKKFQFQLSKTNELEVEEIERMKCYVVFQSKNVINKEIRHRKYLVILDLDSEEFTCICCMFQKDGILCSHVLKIILHLKISRIPEKYIIQRWRKKQMTTDNIKRKSIIPVSESSVLRFNILSRKFYEITSRGAKTIPAYEFLIEEADKINEKLNDLIDNDNEVGVDEVNNDQDANMNDNSENNVVQDERLPEEDFIEDPDIANSKGRPRQRYKTIREQIAEQESYHCSHCGRTDHTFPTCPFKHIEFDLPRKKKRKVQNINQKVRN